MDAPTIPEQGGATEQEIPWGKDELHSDRREAIRRDISRRVRAACADYTDAAFDELVERMTNEQLRGERRANRFPV